MDYRAKSIKWAARSLETTDNARKDSQAVLKKVGHRITADVNGFAAMK